MMALHARACDRRHAVIGGQRGMALITALLLLIVVTIMALSMFRSYGTQERIAGNTRDKQRAYNAAVSAQQYAETWMISGLAPPAGTCNVGFVPAATGEICTNAPPNVLSTPWTTGVTYTQFTANSIGGVSNTLQNQSLNQNATADVYTNGVLSAFASYYDTPKFYVYDLGPNKDLTRPGEVYQITALGYGGSANTVAVVESTYLISTNTAKSPDL